MQLPVVHATSDASAETLVRYFHQTQAHWSAHMAEADELDFGTAWVNPQLGRVYMANRVLDAALPEGMSAAQAMDVADAHYAARGAACWQWVMNPSMPESQTAPLTELLHQRGFVRISTDIMHLGRLPSAPIAGAQQPLQIIPARASVRHARQLYEEMCQRWNEPQLVEATMLHLDDPHYDALIALRDGRAIAHVGVLAMGEVGLVEDVFVTEPARRQHVGTTMVSRALEICARSLFKHILLGVMPDNAPAISLYSKFGFQKTGQWLEYQKRS